MTDYLHKSILPPRKHSNIHPYRWKTEEEGNFAICSNGSSIEVYRISHDGLCLQ